MTVGEVMEASVISVPPETTVAETLMLMKEHQIGSFPVVEAGKLVGMFTLTDILTILAEILAIPREGCFLHLKPVSRRLLKDVMHCVIQADVGIHSAFTITPPRVGEKELVVRLDTEEADEIIAELRTRGYEVVRSCWEICDV
jgi:predicted transcriptional regulator